MPIFSIMADVVVLHKSLHKKQKNDACKEVDKAGGYEPQPSSPRTLLRLLHVRLECSSGRHCMSVKYTSTSLTSTTGDICSSFIVTYYRVHPKLVWSLLATISSMNAGFYTHQQYLPAAAPRSGKSAPANLSLEAQIQQMTPVGQHWLPAAHPSAAAAGPSHALATCRNILKSASCEGNASLASKAHRRLAMSPMPRCNIGVGRMHLKSHQTWECGFLYIHTCLKPW
jgi:hypothetical protein